MRTIEELIKGANAEDWKFFSEWKKIEGRRLSEPERFKWALSSPEISYETKRLLIEEVSKGALEETQKLGKEREYLLKLGVPLPDDYKLRIEGLVSALRYQRLREWRHNFLLGAIMIVAFVAIFLFCAFRPNVPLVHVWELLAIICACVASAVFSYAWASLDEAKKGTCKNEAEMIENSLICKSFLRQLSYIDEQEEKLLEFMGIVAENSIEPPE